jgi:hypothetical protein
MATADTLPPMPLWLSHKERADQAFKAGLYSQATVLYSDAVYACKNASPSDMAKLFANRALAFQRAGIARSLLQSLVQREIGLVTLPSRG